MAKTVKGCTCSLVWGIVLTFAQRDRKTIEVHSGCSLVLGAWVRFESKMLWKWSRNLPTSKPRNLFVINFCQKISIQHKINFQESVEYKRARVLILFFGNWVPLWIFCMFCDTFEKGQYVFQDVKSDIIKIYSFWVELWSSFHSLDPNRHGGFPDIRSSTWLSSRSTEPPPWVGGPEPAVDAGTPVWSCQSHKQRSVIHTS
jgi:hypothetical protein